LDETRRSHRLKEQALRLQGSLLMGVAAAAAGGDVATAWKAVGGLFALCFASSASHFILDPFIFHFVSGRPSVASHCARDETEIRFRDFHISTETA